MNLLWITPENLTKLYSSDDDEDEEDEEDVATAASGDPGMVNVESEAPVKPEAEEGPVKPEPGQKQPTPTRKPRGERTPSNELQIFHEDELRKHKKDELLAVAAYLEGIFLLVKGCQSFSCNSSTRENQEGSTRFDCSQGIQTKRTRVHESRERLGWYHRGT
jgi:hypothetical protein